MTKKFLAFVLAASAVCITGCKPGSTNPDGPVNPSGDTKVVVNPHEAVLTAEEPTIRLAATLEPADATATIEWSSSDTLVAKVNNRGIVEAVDYGECYIYASVGSAKDSCHIIVKSYLESLVFSSAYLAFKEDTCTFDENGKAIIDTMYNDDKTIYGIAYRMPVSFILFSDGFYLNENYEFDGTAKGTIIEVPTYIHYASEYLCSLLGEEGGILYVLGGYKIGTEKNLYTSAAGSINEAEYMKQMKSFVEAFNAQDESYPNYLKAAGETLTTPTLSIREYDAEGGGYYGSYIDAALCTKGEFFVRGRDFAASSKMYSLDYSSITYKALSQDRYFGLYSGLNLDANDADEAIFVDEQVHFDDPVTLVYGTKPTQEAPSIQKIRINSKDINPAVIKKIRQQIKDKDIRVIRMK